MKIPLKYNLRSLRVRKIGTFMTILGVGLTVAIFVSMLALVHGLESTFTETGHENHLVIIRQGSMNEVNSFYNRDLFQTIRFLPGVAKDEKGEPLASGEIAVIINHPRVTGETTNVVIRGLSDTGFTLRPEARLLRGRKFQSGSREIIVSKAVSERFRDMQLGSTVRIARSNWKVVGVFDAGGRAYDSEIWASYEDISQEWDRPIYSSIVLAAENAQAAERIRKRIADDKQIRLQAFHQKQYFRDQMISSIGIKTLGTFIAILMGVGSCFAAMNTMYAAVMARSKEIGTLRALGFRRRSIRGSFLVESLVLAFLGGVLGCLLALPLHGVSTGSINFVTFSEVAYNFRVTPRILLQGMMFSLFVGIVGGFLPARRASRQRLLEVLRD